MDNKNYTVDVIIPVYNPDKKFSRLLTMLTKQTYPIGKLIIMNTEEAYWNKYGYGDIANLEVHHLTKAEFDHGNTRNKGIEYSNADIVVLVTQDAVPKNEFLIEELIKPFYKQDKIAMTYGRQLPDNHCRYIEAYTRSFNYSDQDRLKKEEDLPELGIKTFFASNVCAAYKKDIFNKLGGFTTKTIFNEDMIFGGNAIKGGYGVYYCSHAMVIHSHNYSNIQQFKRNFDLGVSQKDHSELFSLVSSQSEGIRMVKETANYLIKQKKAYLIPELVIGSGFKYLGYLFGKQYKKLPKKVVLAFTMNRYYWKS